MQLTVCTASLHTHKLLGQGSQIQTSTLHFTKRSTHKVTRAHHRPTGSLSQKLSILPVPPALPNGERRPHTWVHLHVADGALGRPFLLSFDHTSAPVYHILNYSLPRL